MDNYSKQLIYDDCNTIISLLPSIQKNLIAAIWFTPFLSLFCREALNYCDKYSISLPMPSSNSFSTDDIRLKLKLFEDTYSKARKIIMNCDYLQDYIFKHRLRFAMMKNWNIHYNLGVFLDETKNIVGNSQYGYYIFQDNRLLKKKIEDVQKITNTNSVKYDIFPDEIRTYAQYCGEIVGTIAKTFNDGSMLKREIKSEDLHIILFYKDFNSNKHFSYMYSGDDGKSLFLYLLHILTIINSATKLFRRFEKDDYGWWLRFYYITYYYASRRMADIKNHFDNNKLVTGNLGSKLHEFLDIGGKGFLHSQFRNCMMHYDLYDKNGNFLISPEHFDPNIPLFGLVESCYAGTTYVQLKLDIIEKLNQMAAMLSKWLDIAINNPSRL